METHSHTPLRRLSKQRVSLESRNNYVATKLDIRVKISWARSQIYMGIGNRILIRYLWSGILSQLCSWLHNNSLLVYKTENIDSIYINSYGD